MVRQTAAGGFVIASHGSWLPGVYATREAAYWAFHFDDVTLQRLAEAVCRRERRAISTGDMRRLRILARQPAA